MPFAFHKFAVLASVAILSGCLSYTEETQKIRSHFLNGRYQDALTAISASPLKDEGRSLLLYHLERAMIFDRLHEKEKSRNELFTADKIADRLYTVSVSKTAATFLLNEGAQDYSGEDYEKTAIHTMLALSYLEEKDFKEARVEARKINTKLYEITQEYEPQTPHYSEDAFARYLAGLIYEAMGELDDAIIDYRKALELYSNPHYRPFYQGAEPRELIEALYRLAHKRGRDELVAQLRERYPDIIKEGELEIANLPEYGEVAVIHEAGQIAIKQAKEFVLPLGRQIVRFSFPYIQPNRYHALGATGLELANGNFIHASNVADLNAIAYQSLEDRRARLLLKGAARLLAKAQLTEQAYHNFGPLAGVAANVYAAVTETADTRGWTLLPAAFYISRVQLAPGTHTLGLKSGGRLGAWQKVTVRKGGLEILRANGA